MITGGLRRTRSQARELHLTVIAVIAERTPERLRDRQPEAVMRAVEQALWTGKLTMPADCYSDGVRKEFGSLIDALTGSGREAAE